MSEISELEGRITAALDRIRRGLDAIPASVVAEAPDPAALSDLEARLDEERTANAQLEERVKALKDRQETRIAALEADVSSERARIQRMDADLQGLRETNADLREVTAQLRAAVADSLAEPELVNRAILAELDGLRATRDADRAEVEAILAELKPIVEEAQ